MNWTSPVPRNSLNRSMNVTEAQTVLQYYQEPFVVLVVRLTLVSAIFLVGLLGNLLVCYVVVKDKLYRSMTYCLVLNLAIADLGLLILSLPLAMFRIEDMSWPAGQFACEVLYPVSDIFQGGSIATITAIAWFRYRGIVSGQVLEPKKAVCQAVVVIALIWPLSFLLFVVPLFFLMKFLISPHGEVFCYPYFPSPLLLRLYNTTTLLLLYILPLGLVLFTYLRIRRRLHESINLHAQMQSERGLKNPDHVAELNHRALRILTPVVVVFAVTMLPFNLLRFLDVLNVSSSIFAEYILLYFKLCILFFVCNSSANPVIYPLVCDDFRRGFKRHVRRWLSCFIGAPSPCASFLRDRLNLFKNKGTSSTSYSFSPKAEPATAVSSV